MEGTEAANVTASGMGAITLLYFKFVKVATTLFQLEQFMVELTHFKNFLPPFNIETSFVDINNFEAIENAIKPNTKVIFIAKA